MMTHSPTEVVNKLRSAFQTNKTLPLKYRLEQLHQLRKFIEENRERIFHAIDEDLKRGKCETDMYDVVVTLNEIKCHEQHLADWMKPQKASRTLTAALDSSYTVADPLGVVLIIAPWNFPIQLTLVPLIGAISGGNCAILKPSELAVATCKLLADELPKYLDNEAFQVIEGGVPVTTDLLKERFDHIFYTGSTTVGKVIMRAAAEHLTPVTLELGGKCPCIVDKDSDYKLAARRISWGKWANNGQVCLAVDYVLLIGDQSDREILVNELKNTMQHFYQGDIRNSDYSRIINERHFDRIKALIDGTKGTKAIGGKEMDRDDKYIEPTVLIDVPEDDVIMQDELFAPILPILLVDSLDEAIRFVNNREKPLGLYYFSSNNNKIHHLLTHTWAGGVTINDTVMHITQDALPFGGVGHSGMGKYHGKYSFETFTHQKAVLHRSTYDEKLMAIRYPPFNDSKNWWSNLLLDRKSVPFT